VSSESYARKVISLITAYGVANAQACVEAQARPDRPILSRCLAMLENESTGRNIFGGEGTACPAEWYEQEVTEERYVVYRDRRDRGETPNGVGPTQITDPSLQIEAQELGGCWIPRNNMDVGFAFLHQLIEAHGPEEGFRSYNGSGPAAVAYGERAMRWAEIWHARFVAHGLT
jgi:hypothetical protein